jgi:hypothetical protein
MLFGSLCLVKSKLVDNGIACMSLCNFDGRTTMVEILNNISHSNTGLRALRRQISDASALNLEGSVVHPDLLAATDGIAITFSENRSSAEIAVLTVQIRAILGPNWGYRDESLQLSGGRFQGLTALPPPDNPPPVGDVWLLTRRLAAIAGIRSAIPLFAQVVPDPMLGEVDQLPVDEAEDEPIMDATLQREWHLQALQVSQAWELLHQRNVLPGQGVTVAVLDTGYTNHPEIFERLIKEDGQPEIVRGVNLIEGRDPRDPLEGLFPLTVPSHGTSVASVIASPVGPPANWPVNKTWMTGIAPAAQIFMVRMTTHVVLLLPNKITTAVREAVDAGADVINVSLGLPYYWPALHAAIQYATEQGVIVVAASGNYWPQVVYPARFPEVLAAACCGLKRREWRWASSGEDVDVLAPGVAVQRAYSKRNGDETDFDVDPGTGTTFAAASCTGLAALWLSYHGGRAKLTDHYAGERKYISQAFHYLMRNTANPLPGVNRSLYGSGLPQADELLKSPLPSIQELNRDAQRRQLTIALTEATQTLELPGLAVDEPGKDFVLAGLDQLLGEKVDELYSEAGFQIASRLELRMLLLADQIEEAREVLLESQHLSTALRQQLEVKDRQSDLSLQAPRAGTSGFRRRTVENPAQRLLRVYAFDPGLASYLRTMDYNLVTVAVPWEQLEPGPVGQYVEVVDIDPASRAAYMPVNLDDARLLAVDGATPDEGDPWFHQQMVYAVAMKTISHFEKALGRPAMWAADQPGDDQKMGDFCKWLRIYPHALRERNAYYSPEKRALLFGYFRSPGQGGAPTGPMVFTCLSYDIIAHETTHALLDGMYHYYIEDTNPDMLAFHEAFADIVALFQHFTHPVVLRAAISETRGDLETESLLGKLAQQFGETTGKRGALRDAIGEIRDGKWQRRQPDADLLESSQYKISPHLRGSILVAAVFDAFLKIYQRRTRLAIRLATGGSGVLPPGNIPIDLAEALAAEAAKTAGHMLNICIRALDYLPPVDLTFGEYLRATITADRELVPDDPLGYRVAIVEAFRAWGIQPEGVTTVAPESLGWSQPEGFAGKFSLSRKLVSHLNDLLPAWRENRSREELDEKTHKAKIRFKKELQYLGNQHLGSEIGINLSQPFDVHTLRPTTAVGPDGTINPMVVVTLLQTKEPQNKETQVMIRTGSTLLFSRGDGKIRYVIHKRDRQGLRAEQTAVYKQFRLAANADFDPYLINVHQGEPFAALHLNGYI